MKNTKQYPKGTFVALGMLCFIPVGIALAIGTKNPGLIGIGPALGLPMGLAWEEQQRKKGKLLSETETKGNKRTLFWILFLLGIMLFGILAFLLIY
ncbi:hypothetical protein E7Z59_02220 [Robertkochia marina]|uniref:Stationary phase survival protein SurE n=1 Tax=Robertkochia marina TaxID=1227945 RepID=A0A4S3M4Q2_9FLAO|nr:hypothetical protein [Robertkochia marina]THD69167.1 hypothetical protein E7Z59_02220 [Robertkochia marina]TRZ47575.1 hypothetical protein D3A96_02380 [Robertkochia marina]